MLPNLVSCQHVKVGGHALGIALVALYRERPVAWRPHPALDRARVDLPLGHGEGAHVGVVAPHLADRKERAKAVQQVLLEGVAGRVGPQPLNGAGVTKLGVIEVVAGDAPYGDLTVKRSPGRPSKSRIRSTRIPGPRTTRPPAAIRLDTSGRIRNCTRSKQSPARSSALGMPPRSLGARAGLALGIPLVTPDSKGVRD
jgi:hypothetical protein